MGIDNLIKEYFLLGFIILILVSSTVSTGVYGFIAESSEKTCEKDDEFYNINFNKLTEFCKTNTALQMESKDRDISNCIATGGPADSPWPMKCHDTRHTGRSEYGTSNNSYYELWRYKFDYRADVDPAIGEDGTIYLGGGYKDMVYCFVAIDKYGALKWRYRTDDLIWHMCPSIAEDGTIYFGSWDFCLHAVNPNGTSKWKFDTNDVITSDPVIGDDGTIYFGTMWGIGNGGKIYGVNPNGTEKWRYKTGESILSDPAIGEDGTIYIGSDDRYIYAIYPNGTLKWRFKTGDWIHGSPSIADDDTIYISSYDGYLYALYPNGTLRWKIDIVYGSDGNPSLGQDGTIYICSGSKLFAINPSDGSKKWVFNLGGGVMKSSPAICADGIIYVGIEKGECKGGEIVGVNPDGTERWRRRLSNCWVDSSPCIGEDGIIYVVSSTSSPYSVLHAFGPGGAVEADANGPYYGFTNEPVNFSGYAVYGYPPYSWHWDFGDGNTSDSQNPSHIYNSPGKYNVSLTVTDVENNTAENITWTTIQNTNDPPDKPVITGTKIGKTGESYDYNFVSNDPENNEIWLFIDWGDGYTEEWIGWYSSGQEITVSHEWDKPGVHTIKAKARDGYDAESEWGELKVTMPINQQSTNTFLDNRLFFRFLEQHPRAFPILRKLV